MLRYLLSGDFNQMIMSLLVGVFVVFCTMPVHEFAHAYAANKLGDNTAKMLGRYTLNPLKHIDPVGCIMIVLFGIGWAKPVPVNPRYFKNMKKGMALTALAGPIANIIMAAIYLLLSNLFYYLLYIRTMTYFALILVQFFSLAASINISLAVFNLLPIPPLDGSRLFTALFPDRIYYKIMQYENIIKIVLIGLLLTGFLSGIISFLSGYVYTGLDFIISLPFKLL